MIYRLIDGNYDIRAWPTRSSYDRWCASVGDTQTKEILAVGTGSSRDAAIADARGKLLPLPEEITRDMPGWRFWGPLAVCSIFSAWCAYIALSWAVS